MHYYGPYSQEVARLSDEMVQAKLLKEESQPNQVGLQYSYHLTKDVDDKEFPLDALGVPDDVPKVHFDDRGQQIRKDTSLPPAKPIRRRNRSWLKWAGYALGFALIALALLRYCLRKKPNNPAG